MFDTLTQTYSAWTRYRRTVSALQRLSFHELEDMGIARGDIPELARKAARR